MTHPGRRAAGVLPQSVDEAKQYLIDFTALAAKFGTPASVNACTLYDLTNDAQVNDLLSGSASLSGNLATSKVVDGLTTNRMYQLNIALNFSNSVVASSYVLIRGE